MKEQEDAKVFDLSGGWLCLDFCNTLSERAKVPIERLRTYSDLLRWGRETNIITAREEEDLARRFEKQPEQAISTLEKAIEIREAFYAVFIKVASGENPTDEETERLNTVVQPWIGQSKLTWWNGAFKWGSEEDQLKLGTLLWEVVRSGTELLTSGILKDLRVCAADDCRWLFVDTTKNHSRRWCDMKTCGNRAKVRQHHERKRQGA